eukprot:1264911-Amphidinium_carterae.2
MLLSGGLDAGGNVSLHTNIGSTDSVELRPGQGWRGMNGIVLRRAVACRRLGMAMPAVLPL